jgi:hypothetical protein
MSTETEGDSELDGDDGSRGEEALNKKELIQQKTGSDILEKGTPARISVRRNSTIAPNSTAAEQFFEDAQALSFAYNEETNTLWMIPLEEATPDAEDEYSVPDETDGGFSITSKPICRKAGIDFDATYRYTPEWDDEFGAVKIDLDQDAEEYQSDSGSGD